jgi:hypothetical protein
MGQPIDFSAIGGKPVIAAPPPPPPAAAPIDFSSIGGKPVSAAPPSTAAPAPAPMAAPSSLWDTLTQKTADTDKNYLAGVGSGKDDMAGTVGADIHGLNEVARGTIAAAKGGVQGAYHAFADQPQGTLEKTLSYYPGLLQAYRMSAKPIVDAAKLTPQIPDAVSDINASPDPLTHYAQAAEDTASQGAGQALAAAITEKLPGALGEAARVTQKGATALGLPDMLQDSASRSMQRVLGPTTKENKAIAANVAPDMAQQGVMAWTRKGLETRAGAEADAAGQAVDDKLLSLPDGESMPTKPILDHLEQGKQQFLGSKGEILDQPAIDRIDGLKQIVQQFGDQVPVTDIVHLRRMWDKQIAQAKGFFGKDVAEGSLLDAKREASGSIRSELAKAYPDLDVLNKKYSFWKNIQDVMSATNDRTASQAPPLSDTVVAAGLGAAKVAKSGLLAGPGGVAAGYGLMKVFKSTAWRTVAAATKYKIGDMLSTGDTAGAASLAMKATQTSFPFADSKAPGAPFAGPLFDHTQTPAIPPATAPHPMPSSTGPVPKNLMLGAGTALVHVPPIEGEYLPETTPTTPIAGLLPSQGRATAGGEIVRDAGPGAYQQPPGNVHAPQLQASGLPETLNQNPSATREAVGMPETAEPHALQKASERKPPASAVKMPWEIGRKKAAAPEEPPVEAPAPPQAPPTAQTAPQATATPLTATPERLAQQAAAVSEAKTMVRAGNTDPVRLAQLREAAHLPELEPESLRGKTTREATQVNGEYTPEALAEHQQKLADKGIGSKATTSTPKVTLMGGGAASGKGSIAKALAKENPNAVYINPDDLMDSERYQTLLKSDPLGAAARAHDEGSDIARKAVTQGIAGGHDLTIDRVSGDPAKAKALMDEAKASGYKTQARFADRDTGEALKGMVDRFEKTGRWVPPDVLAKGHTGAAATFHKLLPDMDEASLETGVIGKREHELAFDNGTVHNQVAWEAHQRKAAQYGGLRSNGEGLGGVTQESTGPASDAGGAAQSGAVQASTGQDTSANQQQQQVTNTVAGAEGGATTLLHSNGNMPAQYRAVESDDLTPSHDPFTFAKKPNYPEGVQERRYEEQEPKSRVIYQGDNYDHRYTVNTNPDAVNGPPVITPDGIVLGGNSRAMSTARMYNGADGGAAYKQAIMDQAKQFGLDPAEVAKMRKPVLVRQVATPEGGVDGMRRLGSDLNKSMTGALGDTERAVSAGKSLRPESLEQIGNMVNSAGDDASLRDVMRTRGKDIMEILQRDGVITDRERPQYVDSTTGGLNEQGKTFAENALLGSVVGDSSLLDRAPKNVLNKLGGSLGDLATLGSRADDYNVVPLVREAIATHADAVEAKGPLEDYLNTPTMFGSRSAAGDVMTRALGGGAKSFRTALRSFANDARADVPGQGTMLMGEKPSAVSAFNHAFHSNLTEAEFREGHIDSDEKESSPGGRLP